MGIANARVLLVAWERILPLIWTWIWAWTWALAFVENEYELLLEIVVFEQKKGHESAFAAAKLAVSDLR